MEILTGIMVFIGLVGILVLISLFIVYAIENHQRKLEKEEESCCNCKYCKAIVYNTCYCDKETETKVPSYCRLFERK